ncbi:MAG: hypothetical protein M0P71_01500 [Melioribacteraceae bacterium]|nr:hypothetical protein [Melioribacteraceae bacterium]
MEYQKTTGKIYKKTFTCIKCKNIYTDSNICPKCGSKEKKEFQRTLASIKEEVENGKHS